MRRFSGLLVTMLLVFTARSAWSQEDALNEARSAMARGEYARAASLLSAAVQTQPSADAYVYLGISYAHTREWMRAEETLKEGATRYPSDPRFHNELAGVYLAANDLDRARESLEDALSVDPDNKYASDLLATVDMSMGKVESALKNWNKDGRPIVGDILHNGHDYFQNWTIGKASAFETGETLTWGNWKTTEARLRATDIYSNVGVEVEPTALPDQYTAVIRTVPKTNGTGQFVIPLLESMIFQDPSVHIWNIRNSAASLNLGYRFATNRLRGEVGILAPLPLPGILFFEATGTYRSERWDIARPAVDTGFDSRFYFQSTGVRAMFKHIPHHRIGLGAGFEYRNRTAHGSQPGLALDSRNTGKLLFEVSLLPFDGRFHSRIHGEGFMAREEFLSDIRYSGGTVEWNNRILLDGDGKNLVELTVKAGTSRGELPVDDYFVLGVRQHTVNFLRGHNTVDSDGHFGNSPMGTSFSLANVSYERMIRRLPFFNVLNFPYVDLKWIFFTDGARTFDRANVFAEGKFLVDVGGGFKLDTPTGALNLTYGRSLRDGTGTFAAYLGKHW
ncbi:MAG TPA: tetratricopeptide repeat protein [Terriglobia bacterium]|nr:tetratricopeptide repeat protein [Terriglobia bacterium]